MIADSGVCVRVEDSTMFATVRQLGRSTSSCPSMSNRTLAQNRYSVRLKPLYMCLIDTWGMLRGVSLWADRSFVCRSAPRVVRI